MNPALANSLSKFEELRATSETQPAIAAAAQALIAELVWNFDDEDDLLKGQGKQESSRWSVLGPSLGEKGITREMLTAIARGWSVMNDADAHIMIRQLINVMKPSAKSYATTQEMPMVQTAWSPPTPRNPNFGLPYTQVAAPIVQGVVLSQQTASEPLESVRPALVPRASTPRGAVPPSQHSSPHNTPVDMRVTDMKLRFIDAKTLLRDLLAWKGSSVEWPALMNSVVAMLSGESLEKLVIGLSIGTAKSFQVSDLELWSSPEYQARPSARQVPVPMQKLVVKQAIGTCIVEMLQAQAFDLEDWRAVMVHASVVLRENEMRKLMAHASIKSADFQKWCEMDFSKTDLDMKDKPTMIVQQKLKLAFLSLVQQKIASAAW
jgi:hypothetical protein